MRESTSCCYHVPRHSFGSCSAAHGVVHLVVLVWCLCCAHLANTWLMAPRAAAALMAPTRRMCAGLAHTASACEHVALAVHDSLL